MYYFIFIFILFFAHIDPLLSNFEFLIIWISNFLILRNNILIILFLYNNFYFHLTLKYRPSVKYIFKIIDLVISLVHGLFNSNI